VLLVSANPIDHDLVAVLVQAAELQPRIGRTYREAMSILCQARVPVIICDQTLPDASWLDVLSQSSVLPDPSRFILITNSVDERLYSLSKSMGVYELMIKPLFPEDFMRVVRRAAKDWSGGRPALTCFAAGGGRSR
jgi:DNA-binding NtrC family response regulator